MVKLITLDLDNTLWDVNPVIRRADRMLKAWMQQTHPDVLDHYTPKTFEKIKLKIEQEQPEKTQLPTYFRKQLLTHCYQQIGLTGKALETQVEAAFEVFFTERNEIDFYPDTLPLLRELKKNFDLIALSNGNADLKRLGLDQYFTGHFCADSIGKAKPDPTMFLAALHLVNVAPEQTIHIGDHPLEDIQAARTLGFRTIWFNENAKQSNKTCSPDREVHQPHQIISAVKSLAH